MDAAGHGKLLTKANLHMDQAVSILDEGVAEEISEYTSLLCADTEIMFAIHRLQDMRRGMEKRMQIIKEEE